MIKSKFIIIFFIILVLSIIFTGYSSAFTFNHKGELIDLGNTDLYAYTFVGFVDDGETLFIVSLEKEPVARLSSNTSKYMLYYTGNGSLYRYTISDKKLYKIYDSYSGTDERLCSFSVNDMIFSDFNVKDSEGNVVFQKPVPTLGEVLVKTDPVKKFQTMISGMIVFLVVFLVSLVGFLKAWSLLSNSLRKA